MAVRKRPLVPRNCEGTDLVGRARRTPCLSRVTSLKLDVQSLTQQTAQQRTLK